VVPLLISTRKVILLDVHITSFTLISFLPRPLNSRSDAQSMYCGKHQCDETRDDEILPIT